MSLKEAELIEVFKEVLGSADNVDPKELVYNEFPGWDSVAHMALIAALEERFDIMLETDDILDMSSFDKAVEIIRKHI